MSTESLQNPQKLNLILVCCCCYIREEITESSYLFIIADNRRKYSMRRFKIQFNSHVADVYLWDIWWLERRLLLKKTIHSQQQYIIKKSKINVIKSEKSIQGSSMCWSYDRMMSWKLIRRSKKINFLNFFSIFPLVSFFILLFKYYIGIFLI